MHATTAMALPNKNPSPEPKRRDKANTPKVTQGWLARLRRQAADQAMANGQEKPDAGSSKPSKETHPVAATTVTHSLRSGKERLIHEKEVVLEKKVGSSTSSDAQDPSTPSKGIMKPAAGQYRLSSGDFQANKGTPSKKAYQELAHLGEDDRDSGPATPNIGKRSRVVIQDLKKKGAEANASNETPVRKAYQDLAHLDNEDSAATPVVSNVGKRSRVVIEEPKKKSAKAEKKKQKEQKLKSRKSGLEDAGADSTNATAATRAKLPSSAGLSTDPYVISAEDPPGDLQWKMDNLLDIVKNDEYKPAFTFEYREGSVFEAKEEHVLVHSCNCQGFWGKGFALELRHRFPRHYKVYREYCNEHKDKVEDMLGTMLLLGPHNVDTDDQQLIACLFTRETPSKAEGATDGSHTVAYTDVALDQLQVSLEAVGREHITDIVMPKINAGLFGIPWHETEHVLNEAEVVERYPTRRIIVYDGGNAQGNAQGNGRGG